MLTKRSANGLQFVKLMLYGVVLPRWPDRLSCVQYIFPIAGMLNILNEEILNFQDEMYINVFLIFFSFFLLWNILPVSISSSTLCTFGMGNT